MFGAALISSKQAHATLHTATSPAIQCPHINGLPSTIRAACSSGGKVVVEVQHKLWIFAARFVQQFAEQIVIRVWVKIAGLHMHIIVAYMCISIMEIKWNRIHDPERKLS